MVKKEQRFSEIYIVPGAIHPKTYRVYQFIYIYKSVSIPDFQLAQNFELVAPFYSVTESCGRGFGNTKTNKKLSQCLIHRADGASVYTQYRGSSLWNQLTVALN